VLVWAGVAAHAAVQLLRLPYNVLEQAILPAITAIRCGSTEEGKIRGGASGRTCMRQQRGSGGQVHTSGRCTPAGTRAASDSKHRMWSGVVMLRWWCAWGTRTRHLNAAGCVDRSVGGKLRALYEVEDDAVLLPDEAGSDVAERQCGTHVTRATTGLGAGGHRHKLVLLILVVLRNAVCQRTRLRETYLSCQQCRKKDGCEIVYEWP
jgi:hypothetical protein